MTPPKPAPKPPAGKPPTGTIPAPRYLLTTDTATYKTGVAIFASAQTPPASTLPAKRGRLVWVHLAQSKSKSLLVRAHEIADSIMAALQASPLMHRPGVKGPSSGPHAVGVADLLTDVHYRQIHEYPRIEKFGRGVNIPPDVVLGIVLVLGGIRNVLPRPGSERLVRPSEWKSNTDGDAMTNHIFGRLTAEEQALVIPFRSKKGAEEDNVLDAVGIGLWELGRL